MKIKYIQKGYKKRLHQIAVAAMATVALVSCNSFLDTEPYASISQDKAITNYNNAIYALTGTYNSLQSTSYYGRDFIVTGDASTDNVIVSPNNSNRFIAQAQWSMSATNGDLKTLWAKAYQAIDDANKILEAVDNIDATAGEIAFIKAQTLSIRALAHFDLVRYFAQTYSGNENTLGIPYMLKSITYDKPARNTVKEVYDYIIQDLQNALTHFTTAQNAGIYATSGSGEKLSAPYYMTQWAAKSILAKVYMNQLNYTLAAPLLNDIITNSGYSILPAGKYVDAWSRSYNNASQVEFIFAIRNTPDDYGATNCLGYIYIQAGYGDLRAPVSLQALYKPTDIRRQVLFTPGTATQTGWTFINKYPGRDGTLGLSDIPVIRLSDLYLLYAESIADTDKTNAIYYLDQIRQRADASAQATPADISTNDLLEKIFLERRKELAYEGQYLFDLKRLKKTVPSGYRSDNTLYTTISYPSKLLAMPIPQAEIDANPNMVQNE